MPRDLALRFAGASQAGVDFGPPSSRETANWTVVRRAVRKGSAETAAEERIAQVANIDGWLFNAGEASISV